MDYCQVARYVVFAAVLDECLSVFVHTSIIEHVFVSVKWD